MGRNDRFFKKLDEMQAMVALLQGPLQAKMIENLGKKAAELSRETLEAQQQPNGRPWQPLKGDGEALRKGMLGPQGRPPLANVAGFLAYLESGLIFTLIIPNGWAHFHQYGYHTRTAGSSKFTAARAEAIARGVAADISERKRRGSKAYRVPIRRIFPSEKTQIPPRWSKEFEIVVHKTAVEVTGQKWTGL